MLTNEGTSTGLYTIYYGNAADIHFENQFSLLSGTAGDDKH
jgi:hypothetical protein